MAKSVGPNYQDIIKEVEQRRFVPVYLLMGEESYYIDMISDTIAATVLTEEEQGFNQMVMYCTRETDVTYIITAAKRYPMMAEYQVVIVKEAQNLLRIDELTDYVLNPLRSTILVICYKNGTVDKRKKLVAAIQKNGVVYESQKLNERALPIFISDYLKAKQKTIDTNASMMMADHIGADLNRLASELDKLVIALPKGESKITADLVEENVGISKEFNNWELRNALMVKDVFKANRILSYFESNPKSNPADRFERPRRHPRRREILYGGQRFPFSGHADIGVRRFGELACGHATLSPLRFSRMGLDATLCRCFVGS